MNQFRVLVRSPGCSMIRGITMPAGFVDASVFAAQFRRSGVETEIVVNSRYWNEYAASLQVQFPTSFIVLPLAPPSIEALQPGVPGKPANPEACDGK